MNKVLVVVGGTTGLGFSAARAFVRAGAHVVVIGRNATNVREAGRRLGDGAKAFRGDAMDPATAPRAIEVAMREFGAFHGLYHVAGGSGRSHGDGSLHEVKDEGWDHTIALNLTSVVYSNRAAVRQFLKQGTSGSVLNMASVLGFSPSPRHFDTAAYAAAKAGVIGLTRNAAARYARENIRFNVVAPALVATPMSRRAESNPEILRFITTKQPLDGGRIGRPEDLDAAVVYLMSDQAGFVTGQVLAVDGGWSVSEGQAG